MESLGRMAWQEAAGDGKRLLVDAARGRFKTIIGARLRSRRPDAQRCEAPIGVAVLNRMMAAARPNSVMPESILRRLGHQDQVSTF